jgi:hypothetical protein
MSKNPSGENIRKIESALNEILNFYAGKTKTISQSTVDFIQGTEKRNIFQDTIKFIEHIISDKIGVRISNPLEIYFYYISQIKKYNPEGYKEFLKDLYKTIDKAKDDINDILNDVRKTHPTGNIPQNITLKEMKQPLNEEFRRMQKLAGLITENEHKELLFEVELEQSIEAELKKIASQLKSASANVKPSPKDGELEEVFFTLYSLIVGAPGLMSFLGKAADSIADVIKKGSDAAVFKASTYKKGGSTNIPPSIGNGLRKAGHALEEFYLDSLGGWLQTSFPKKYTGQNVKDKTSKLYDDAHKIYAGLLIAGAVGAGFEAVHAANAIVQGLEGGAAALKTKEIVDVAQKIAAA